MTKKFAMFQLGNTVISLDLLEEYFVCDLQECKGACCVLGDSGAPLDVDEADTLSDIFEIVKPYMQPQGVAEVLKSGCSVIDSDGDLVTPLIDGKECAYAYFDKGIAKCAIEKAYLEKKISFRKPVSCYLYPVRVKKIHDLVAVNYHKWDVCSKAVINGKKLNTPSYVFLKEPLTQRFGQDWYNELVVVCEQYKKDLNNKI